MKQLIAILVMAFATAACAKEEPKKPVEKPAVTQKVEGKKVEENTNCVKKDKKGKCPPLPNSPKPTPKKVEPK